MRFVSDGWRVRVVPWLAIAGAAFAVLKIVDVSAEGASPRPFDFVVIASWLASSGLFTWAFLKRRRPVVSLLPGVIEYGPIFRFAPPLRVAIDQVTGAELRGTLLRLDLRDGGVERIPVGTLSPARRAEVRDAVLQQLDS